MKLNKKFNSKGFTLIELLIVIIIIGILAAIAFVSYSGLTNKASKSDAQTTLSQASNKLGEYKLDQGYYPTDKATFVTWLQSDKGGSSQSFASTDNFGASTYSYADNDGSGGACDNSTTKCVGYTLTADKSIWGGDTDLTKTN
jgi:type IV pilus assembly protein PilE